jgi:hypothetical protein
VLVVERGYLSPSQLAVDGVSMRRLLAVVLWGIFATGMDLTLWVSLHPSQAPNVDFVGPTGHRGFTSRDHSMGLILLALGGTGAFIGSNAALFPSGRRWLVRIGRSLRKRKSEFAQFSVADNAAAGLSWTCPHCHEENPGNFEECWKCQKNRPTELKL